jgi:hypothetical protein
MDRFMDALAVWFVIIVIVVITAFAAMGIAYAISIIAGTLGWKP